MGSHKIHIRILKILSFLINQDQNPLLQGSVKVDVLFFQLGPSIHNNTYSNDIK
jgi:hypothetical protein